MICSLESGVHSNSWTASCAMPLSMEPVAFFLCKSTKSQQQVPPISMQHFSTTDGSRSTTTSTKIHMPRSILQAPVPSSTYMLQSVRFNMQRTPRPGECWIPLLLSPYELLLEEETTPDTLARGLDTAKLKQ